MLVQFHIPQLGLFSMPDAVPPTPQDPMSELAAKFEAMTLQLAAIMTAATQGPRNQPLQAGVNEPDYRSRDSLDHMKQNCSEMQQLSKVLSRWMITGLLWIRCTDDESALTFR
jgi:hypothetical protein